ncbi:MAG TPA: hypothetical protein VKV57_01400 [bacterium]|nr:hypothetical protein [bacterium]
MSPYLYNFGNIPYSMSQVPWYIQLVEKWPDFVVTFFGVLAGAYLAYRIERKVAHSTLSTERSLEESRDQEYLLVHLDRLKIEIRDNQQTVPKVIEALNKALIADRHRRVILLGWAAKLAGGLSVAAYENLSASGLLRLLPDEIQASIFDARQRTANLRAMVEAGEPAMSFYASHLDGDLPGETHIKDILSYSHTTYDGLKTIKEEIFKFTGQFKERVRARTRNETGPDAVGRRRPK